MLVDWIIPSTSKATPRVLSVSLKSLLRQGNSLLLLGGRPTKSDVLVQFEMTDAFTSLSFPADATNLSLALRFGTGQKLSFSAGVTS